MRELILIILLIVITNAVTASLILRNEAVRVDILCTIKDMEEGIDDIADSMFNVLRDD